MVVLKFLLDENISLRLIPLLKKKKFDAISVHSLSLHGIPNGDLFLKAFQMQRILVTFDKDYLQLVNRPPFGILMIDIHPARDIFVLPVFEKFLENPIIYQLKWIAHIIFLTKEGVEIVNQNEGEDH